jgi:hypothetical protein
MIHKHIISAVMVLLANLKGTAFGTVQVFWSDSDASTVWRANGDGSNSSTILPLAAGAEPRGIAIDATSGFLYWAENGTNRIRRAGLDGSSPQDIVTSG